MSNDKRLLLLPVRAFFVYVRPILFNIVQSCGHHALKRYDCIEKVQRQFTKRLPGLKSMSYTDRLKCLGHDYLRTAPFTSGLNILLQIIVFGMVAIISDIFEFSRVSKTKGHAYKLFKSHSNNSTRYRFFC